MIAAMTWSASQRYDLDPAPGGLALIQDLLNTGPRPSPETADLLETVRAAQAWSNAALRQWAQDTGHAYRKLNLTKSDVERLRTLRSDLAAVLRDHRGADSRTSTGAVLGEFCTSAVMAADGTITLEPEGLGWHRIGSAVAIEAYRAQVAGTWRRLKVCRNDRCPGAFYDRSPNNSGAWHDVRTCGNVANLRAARARRKSNAG